MGAVEYGDFAARRRCLMDAPQVVMPQLPRARRLESRDGAALRVEGAEHAADRAVLAAAVDRLQADQHGEAAVRIHLVLQLLEFREVLGVCRGRLVFFPTETT